MELYPMVEKPVELLGAQLFHRCISMMSRTDVDFQRLRQRLDRMQVIMASSAGSLGLIFQTGPRTTNLAGLSGGASTLTPHLRRATCAGADLVGGGFSAFSRLDGVGLRRLEKTDSRDPNVNVYGPKFHACSKQGCPRAEGNIGPPWAEVLYAWL
ncbi:hypothetical protein OsI_06960 [Oryza sativa Indica Group]|uniref:Uncharacterized protein n=1 Tax=Oryza sativa subsp. indica TaxID=39946 RepID=B8AGA4_ORYSI|nr:hypothetical protein OsI_06960 [Oryza sativa Indica Group]